MTQPQWDDVRVGRWLGKLDALEAQLQPVSDALFDAAALEPGLAVLDVGCGAGSTTRHAFAAVTAAFRDALRSALAPHHDGTGIAAAGGFMIVSAIRG